MSGTKRIKAESKMTEPSPKRIKHEKTEKVLDFSLKKFVTKLDLITDKNLSTLFIPEAIIGFTKNGKQINVTYQSKFAHICSQYIDHVCVFVAYVMCTVCKQTVYIFLLYINILLIKNNNK